MVGFSIRCIVGIIPAWLHREDAVQDEVIEGSRSRAVGLGVGVLAMGALCLYCLTLPNLGPKAELVLPLAVPLCFAAAAAYFLQAFQPLIVRLTATGFSVTRMLGSPKIVAWADIEPLFVWTYRRTSLVGFRYRPGRRPSRRSLLERINERHGMDGYLPNTLPIRGRALAELMNARRAAALAQRPT